MDRRRLRNLISFFIGWNFTSPAAADLCDASKQFCGYWKGHESPSGAPTHSGKINVNPSAVPIENSFGIEGIYFDSSVDLALVKGLGRVGAAISPSNSEETFFGPPGIELSQQMLLRHRNKSKYPSQKVTLATAVGLYSNKQSGLKRVDLNLGVMGKYNTKTHAVTPGGGLSGVLGPFTFGYSRYRDETEENDSAYVVPPKYPVTKYQVETFSAGVFMDSLAVDYSLLRMISTSVNTTTVLTGTLLLKKSMLTMAWRQEKSSRPAYDYSTQTLVVKEVKDEVFFGLQFNVTRHLMLGAFYNYYVLREVSVGGTLFF